MLADPSNGRNLPPATRLVILFGIGTRENYVTAARNVIEQARPGTWTTINEVAYSDGKVTFVHVEHFASHASLLSRWLSEYDNDRAKYGVMAREAVMGSHSNLALVAVERRDSAGS